MAKAQTEQTDTLSLPTDVYASYLVVTPGDGFTSMLGHAAIRMSCPSAGLDYCFTVKSPEIGNEFTAMTLRTLQAGIVPEETALFLQDYQQEGRGISEYYLRLTLDETRHLWKILDDCVALGLARHIDYIHNGCAQEMVSIIFAAVQDRHLPFDEMADELLPYETRRQILARYKDTSSWKGFIGHTLYGGTPDETVRGTSKLIMPLDVAALLEKAELADLPTELAAPTDVEENGTSPLLSPRLFAILFLLLCLLPVSTPSVRRTLLVLHFLVGVFLVWMVFVSRTPGTEWNWFLIPFNPIPLLVSRWAGRRTYAAYTVILLAFVAFMLVNLGRIFFIEQLLIVTGVLIRTIYQTFNINLLKTK